MKSSLPLLKVVCIVIDLYLKDNSIVRLHMIGRAVNTCRVQLDRDNFAQGHGTNAKKLNLPDIFDVIKSLTDKSTERS